MEKEDSTNDEFIVPKRLKNYGRKKIMAGMQVPMAILMSALLQTLIFRAVIQAVLLSMATGN